MFASATTANLSKTREAQELVRQESLAISQGLKRQDVGLLDELIVRYQHRLLRYLLYLTSNREQAEDLFQEVWMRVLLRGGQFNGKARFDTWLFTVARNLVIDLRRKRTMSSLDEMFESSGDVQSFVQGRLPPMSRQENYCNGRSPGQPGLQDSKSA